MYKTFTKRVYTNDNMLGIPIPTRKKIVFEYNTFTLTNWWPRGKGSNYIIKDLYDNNYYLSCPKEKIPSSGFIKIGKSKLYMKLMHELDDKRKGDNSLYTRIDINLEENDYVWCPCVEEIKKVCWWMGLLDMKVNKK